MSWTFPNFWTISLYIDVNFRCLRYTWDQNVLLWNSASKTLDNCGKNRVYWAAIYREYTIFWTLDDMTGKLIWNVLFLPFEDILNSFLHVGFYGWWLKTTPILVCVRQRGWYSISFNSSVFISNLCLSKVRASGYMWCLIWSANTLIDML